MICLQGNCESFSTRIRVYVNAIDDKEGERGMVREVNLLLGEQEGGALD
jgi:hypothetical protein